MAEKKIQENPLPEEQPTEQTNQADKPKEVPMKTIPDKTTTVVLPSTPPAAVSPRMAVPTFTKTSPNDLYRRLLPAVLFVLTFVTVMTMLLIYMDNVAMGAQQFRVNMSRDYELARIPQESPALVAYVRQLHLAPRVSHHQPQQHTPTRSVKVLDQLYGEIYNGTFVEVLESGPRDPSTLYLGAARGWAGLAARAAARAYLSLKGRALATLHACLSPTPHPREVTYHESESPEAAFSSRVLCLPLYTMLLAADATHAVYVVLDGPTVPPALRHVPFGTPNLRLQVIEFRSADLVARNHTTEFLATKNYTVAASFDDSIMYTLKEA
ncbi:protein Star [Achroia grisella]|uniref:protein Star n=1 Tax=Achroia grisella TaxID=688607 RepID=UPI0027D29F59|nr:protein Star [Achroia grisella]